MTDYIERSVAIARTIKLECEGLCPGMDFVEFRKMLANLPAADVVPVRHGLWFDNDDYMFCSCCGMQWNYCDNDTQDFKFCPHCGAKMDGGERNGQAD